MKSFCIYKSRAHGWGVSGGGDVRCDRVGTPSRNPPHMQGQSMELQEEGGRQGSTPRAKPL